MALLEASERRRSWPLSVHSAAQAHGLSRAAQQHTPPFQRPATHSLNPTPTHASPTSAYASTSKPTRQQLEEGDVIEKLEQLCDARRPEGEWLRTVDMVEDGDAIALKDMGKVRGGSSPASLLFDGSCSLICCLPFAVSQLRTHKRTQCPSGAAQPPPQSAAHNETNTRKHKTSLPPRNEQVGKHTVETSTIARACAEVSDALDLSDLSEALYLGKPRSALAQLACYDMSGACRAKPPPVPEVMRVARARLWAGCG